MRKWLWVIALLLLILVFVAYDQLYYPSLPIESISKKEVLEIADQPTGGIVKVTEEESADWFITQAGEGNSVAAFKNMLRNNGWSFQKQEGSGYFFEKDAETIIVTTQIWAGDYLFVKVPEG
ncbi:hypothetical protein MUN88_02315 [Gracilibacillus caseinilyticus]|uniref:DUF4340 domain-containing protein n=1 Tax=Gracilibacillus caseinilyticus TaxID=2932256 RepID=A0ABY4EYQ5_9BACI|nr:hypothetical protein [Gracilibacillus caseinilyticus]UOQ48993.1 hypothetical protein MUN88_02315 [Gracilibacillus caseinilyticus]